jgi:hypothetical protein
MYVLVILLLCAALKQLALRTLNRILSSLVMHVFVYYKMVDTGVKNGSSR